MQSLTYESFTRNVSFGAIKIDKLKISSSIASK